MQKLLIAGVPGTGKTTVGDYLAAHHGFYHKDMEENHYEPIHAIETDPEVLDCYF